MSFMNACSRRSQLTLHIREEEDEETKEWEQEQLRRGGLRAESVEPAAKPVYKPAPIPPVTPIPTMSAAVARLTQSMSELTTSHAQHSAAMAKVGEEQRLLDAREKEMREMIAKAEEKRSWFAAFREFVESVATFLDEKVSYPFPCAPSPTPAIDTQAFLYLVPSAREARGRAHLHPQGTREYDLRAAQSRSRR